MRASAYILAFCGVWLCVYIILRSTMKDFAINHSRKKMGQEYNPIERFISLVDLRRLRMMCGLGMAIVFESILIYASVSAILAHLFVSLCVFALGYYLPLLWYRYKVKKRRQEFSSKLLDFTMGLKSGLKAGVALPQTLKMVGKDMGGVFQEEIMIVLEEREANVPLVDALWNLSIRMPDENLTLLVTSIALTQKTGGSLADILEKIIETIRNRNAFQDKIASSTAAGKADAVMMSLAPVALFVYLFWKDSTMMMPMVTTYSGWIAIGIAVGLCITGGLVIRKMCATDY